MRMMADRDRSQSAMFWEDLKPAAYCIYDVPKMCFCALKFKNLVVKWGKLIRYTEIHMPKWHILRPPPTGKKTLFSGHWEYQVPMRSLCGGSSRRVLVYTWCPSVIVENTVWFSEESWIEIWAIVMQSSYTLSCIGLSRSSEVLIYAQNLTDLFENSLKWLYFPRPTVKDHFLKFTFLYQSGAELGYK